MSDWQAVRPDPSVLLREYVEARDGAGRLTDEQIAEIQRATMEGKAATRNVYERWGELPLFEEHYQDQEW